MHTDKLDSRLETGAWGFIILLLGGLSLMPGDQSNIFIFSVGIILLGLNLLRYINGLQINAFSIVLGTITLILGGIASLRSILGWEFHFELSIFPILLMAFGLYLLIPSKKQKQRG